MFTSSPKLSFEVVREVAQSCSLEIADSLSLSSRPALNLPVPEGLESRVKAKLSTEYPSGLYKHQSMALESVLAGRDVALSTSTASGKSLVFISAALHTLLRDPRCKVLCFYPAKALIQDQLEKWQSAASPFGITVAFIDGTVAAERRRELLRSNRIILMTPDVAHAWMMSNIREREIAAFLSALKLLILDEAHVYEGVFGTNMAYLMRRLDLIAGPHQVLCSTATLGKPTDFVYQLTGRHSVSIDHSLDGSFAPERHVLLARDPGFEGIVNLLRRLSEVDGGRFLAFSDSRKIVEQIVAATMRGDNAALDETAEAVESDELPEINEFRTSLLEPRLPSEARRPILPFRAGYEIDDARDIQLALVKGKLGGVVSTSAMELGLDIGEIDLVVLLNVPPTRKAFWQRLGRAGRRRPGVCLMLDTKGAVASTPDALKNYLSKALEPSWLYLKNKYLQYANVLCSALEISELGLDSADQPSFKTLPESFRRLLQNELEPSESVASDLYPLKQRAQAGPHREFPLRSGIEQDFKVQDERGLQLGNLTFSQMLREAYPGAIYYYISRPYRIVHMDMRKGEISARRTKHWTTKPKSNTIVFPRFLGGVLSVRGDENGFLAETELQVSERVTGFEERRGSAKPEQYHYGAESNYFRRDLNRFFESTGVCWWFGNRNGNSEEIGPSILQAFCLDFGVQERDLGLGLFHSKTTPFGAGKCQGLCIYDAVSGSLRLTQRLAENFAEVLSSASAYAAAEGKEAIADQLKAMQEIAANLRPSTSGVRSEVSTSGQWTRVIADGEKAIYISEDGPREVTVIQHLFTPKGLMYSLVPERGAEHMKWMVVSNALQVMHGSTRTVLVDLMTGELKEEAEIAAKAS